jgi:hypothetical protein
MTDDDPHGARRLEPRKIRERRQQFVKVRWAWIERLCKARRASTLKVALFILHLDWKHHGRPFALGNHAMAEDGISRYQKRDALRELEQLGLISIQRRRRKSPLITISI